MSRIYSLDEKMLVIDVAILNASREAVLRPYLDSVGYTVEKVAEGRTLFSESSALVDTQKDSYLEQYKMTERREQLDVECWDSFSRHLKLVKILYPENKVLLRGMGLLLKKKTALAKWYTKVRYFYTTILKDETILADLAANLVTREDLEAVVAKCDEIRDIKTLQEKWKSVAQSATMDRDEALDRLFDWYNTFMRFAEVALEEKPQLLEMLGKKVKS